MAAPVTGTTLRTTAAVPANSRQYVCIYICMFTHTARVWINRVRLSILHVVSLTGKLDISLSAFSRWESGHLEDYWPCPGGLSAVCMYVCMFVCMVTQIARVWINRVRLPILHVVSWTRKLDVSLSACTPKNHAIGTQLRDPINSGLTRWRMVIINE